MRRLGRNGGSARSGPSRRVRRIGEKRAKSCGCDAIFLHFGDEMEKFRGIDDFKERAAMLTDFADVGKPILQTG